MGGGRYGLQAMSFMSPSEIKLKCSARRRDTINLLQQIKAHQGGRN
jgi:hypothetical protein